MKNTLIMDLKTSTVVSMILFCFVGFCQTAFAGDRIQIRAIKPVPHFDRGEYNFEEAKKNRFQVRGILDYVGEKHITVNDMALPLAPRTSISSSLEGRFVGIRVDSAGRVYKVQRIRK